LLPWFTLMGQFSAVNVDATRSHQLQKLHDLARQKETLAGSLLLCIIGIAGSGCRGTVRRLVGGGPGASPPQGDRARR